MLVHALCSARELLKSIIFLQIPSGQLLHANAAHYRAINVVKVGIDLLIYSRKVKNGTLNITFTIFLENKKK